MNNLRRTVFAAFLITAVFSGVFTKTVLGSSDPAKNSVHINEGFRVETPFENGLILIFSKAEINASHEGSVFLFFSDFKITGNQNGNVYSFFSTADIREFSGKIYSLSSRIQMYTNSAPPVSILRLFDKIEYYNGYLVFEDTIPPLVIQIFFVLLQIFAVIIFYMLKKGFMEQGSAAICFEPEKVFRNGVSGYFIALCIIFIFAATIAFLPISLIIIAVAFILMLIGETSLSLVIGYRIGLFLQDKYKKTFSPAVYLIFGEIIIGLLKSIPVLGWFSYMLALPVVGIGITITGLINGYFKKKYYEIPELLSGYGNNKKSKLTKDEIKKAMSERGAL